ncbi:TPA: tetratricopeptide repeat protein [Candidatus Poribacteria bacterium]|nr:tetratricopeptide repeat protein [Candidatus Poribacteria bacterium]
MNLEDVVIKQEDIESNIATYQETVELNPQDANAYNKLASAYFNQGEYESAIVAYKSAIKLVPNDADACNSLGAVYYEHGSIERDCRD